jgi:PAS domain S-box-containing protein
LLEIIFETDISGKITFFNHRAFLATGFKEEELQKAVIMLQFVVPQDRESKRKQKKALLEKERENHEYAF